MTAPVPQDRPDAPELLVEVARHLLEDVLPHVPPDRRFGVRVAANCCAMVAREWEAGPGRPDRRAQADLARAIRAGDHDDRLAQTAATLRAEVAAKLAVSHPGWTDFADDGRG